MDQSIGITLSAGVGLGINPILSFGEPRSRSSSGPSDLVAGRAIAVPSGSPSPRPAVMPAPPATRALPELDGDDWVIDGAKSFITNSGSAITSVVTVTARTGPDEISALLVPAGTPGFTVEPAYEKLGWRISDTHGLSFADCRVPAGNLVGERGRGFKQFRAILDDGRIAISALAVGLAQACLEASQRNSLERYTFGAPIGVAAVDRLCHQRSGRGGPGRAPADLQGRLAQGRRPRTGRDQAGRGHRQAVFDRGRRHRDPGRHPGLRRQRLHGGVPGRAVRSRCQDLEIGEGTSEVQRMVIARGLGLPVA